MKAKIHPKMFPVVFLDTTSGVEFVSTSTRKSDETKKIGGVDHYVLRVEISSASHPFYTGKQTLVDTAGRVDKFNARMKKAQTIKEKKVKKVDGEELGEFELPKEEREKSAKKTSKKTAKA